MSFLLFVYCVQLKRISQDIQREVQLPHSPKIEKEMTMRVQRLRVVSMWVCCCTRAGVIHNGMWVLT